MSYKLLCTAAKDDGLNIPCLSRMLTAFAIVSVLGTILDSAGGAPNQKEKSPSTAAKDKAAPSDATPPDAATSSLPSPELAAVKVAIALARRGELVQASDVEEGIGDPVARQVVEWAILRSDKNEIDFRRYVAFISDNPSWPGIGLLRRRAEAALWKERLDPQTVRAYFDKDQPLTAQGKFALARALLLEGDRSDAQSLVREAWRYDRFQAGLWLRPLTMDVRTRHESGLADIAPV